MPSVLVLSCSFLAGSLSLTLLTKLPPLSVFACLGAIALLALVRNRQRPLACFLVGLSLSGLAADHALNDRLAPSQEGRDHSLSARIEDFPDAGSGLLRLVIVPLERPDLPARIRLTWIEPPQIPRIGETWRLTVRLRQPGGYANPHGFDFDKWLYRERIGATGYVVGDAHNYRVAGQPRPVLDQIRDTVVGRIDRQVEDSGVAAVLMAIAVGARHGISRQQWDDFAATGTSHLMAISGLHVGLAGASTYCLLRFLLAPVFAHRSARGPALTGAAIAATTYAILSGLGLPAMRALVTAVLALALLGGRRRLPPSTLLAIVLVLVVAVDPLSTLSPGFRLSFGAVATLLVALKVNAPPPVSTTSPALNRLLRGFRRLTTLQLALLIGLFPLTIIEFNRVSVIAPVVNLLVMPVFNFFTVPSMLVGVLLDGPLAPIGDALIRMAGGSIHWLLKLIGAAGTFDGSSYQTASPIPWYVLLAAPVTILCPRGIPGRELGLVCLLHALAFTPSSPPSGCVDLHTLDVGQGLAVVARTRTRTMLYDTGPAYLNGGGTFDLVVRPFLQSIGVHRLDKVVLSHDDLDHAGGIHSLLATMEVGEVIASTPGLVDVTDTQCIAGLGWRSDGVTFRILHPKVESPWSGNNASCVLEIRTGGMAMLLPGDIERPVEVLMAWRGQLMRSDIVIVPHHGSRTSSSDALVSATRPAIAIVPAAWKNRWGFPKPDVVNRWQQAGAIVFNTASDGAISTRVCADGLRSLERSRERYRRYWHEDRKSPY